MQDDKSVNLSAAVAESAEEADAELTPQEIQIRGLLTEAAQIAMHHKIILFSAFKYSNGICAIAGGNTSDLIDIIGHSTRRILLMSERQARNEPHESGDRMVEVPDVRH